MSTEKNNIILAIEKTEKQKINNEMKKQSVYKVTQKVTEKNKTLTITENTKRLLQENGIEVTKKYFSYNSTPNLYNMLYKVFTENKDTFTIIAK